MRHVNKKKPGKKPGLTNNKTTQVGGKDKELPPIGRN